MYGSMGVQPRPLWASLAASQFASQLDRDLTAFVVDHPSRPGLCASGCGLVATRLASPTNLSGRVGYIQWVCTDPEERRQGHTTRIMTALLDWYEQEGVTVVELHATEAGEPIYRRLGFGTEGGVALRRRSWDIRG
jgi:GNAT superfamily N-acetyltransferase